jgi:hypothetical protein
MVFSGIKYKSNQKNTILNISLKKKNLVFNIITKKLVLKR